MNFRVLLFSLSSDYLGHRCRNVQKSKKMLIKFFVSCRHVYFYCSSIVLEMEGLSRFGLQRLKSVVGGTFQGS